MPSAKLLADVLSGWSACGECVETRGRISEVTPSAQSRSEDGAPDREQLARAIAGEVIPRLMLAHRVELRSTRMASTLSAEPSPEDVAELVRLVLEHDAPVALGFVQSLQARGLPVESLYLDLLAPAARLLGEMWKADLCDFTDVTVGLSRLQHLLHEFSPKYQGDDVLPEMTDRKILLVPAPGEQHTFGIMVVEEFFRRAGWECCTAMPQSNTEIAGLVRKEHFDVLGISLSCDHLLGKIEKCIAAARKASRNKGLTVMVGGQQFIERPEYVARVGADFCAVDGRQAVLQLRTVFDTKAARLT